jgi:hypothetical protein
MSSLVLTDDEGRARKFAMNQSTFRAANERLRRAAASHGFRQTDRVPFICALSDYEHIRAHPTWFLLVAGHEEEDAGLERVIDAEHGYAVVEKVGTAGKEAARLHPRQHDGD